MKKTFLLSCFVLFVSATCFAEGFIKGGIIVHPDDDEIKDRWLLAGGSDFQTAENMFLGFELAGAFYTDQVGQELSLNVAPINAFFNLKVKGSSGGVRPFGGAGIGIVSFLVTVGDQENYDADLGFHFMGGLEFGGLQSTAFLVEVQGQKNLSEDGSDFVWIAYIGARF